MPRPQRPEYKTQAFHDAWHSDLTIRQIADALGVSTTSVSKEAKKQGFPGKLELRRQNGMHLCPKCKVRKPRTEFYLYNDWSIRSHCKECVRRAYRRKAWVGAAEYRGAAHV